MGGDLGPGVSEALFILVAVIFAPYLFGPFVFYFRGSQPVLVGWKVLDETDEPVGGRSGELTSLGFGFAGYLQIGTGMRLAYFTHPLNKDSAEVILGLFGGRLDTLVFKTRFEDDFALEVGSSPNVPFQGAGNPRFHAFNFPQLNATAVLYQVHLELREQYLDSRRPAIAEGRLELFEFARKAEEVHIWRMSAWGYKLSQNRDRFVLTVMERFEQAGEVVGRQWLLESGEHLVKRERRSRNWGLPLEDSQLG